MVLPAEPGSLTVHFEVTRADLEACAARQLGAVGGVGPWRQAMIMVLAVAVMVGVIVFSTVPAGPARWVAMVAYSIAACWILWKGLFRGRSAVARVVDRTIANGGGEAIFAPEHISISESGLRAEHGHTTIIQRWAGVRSIELEDDAIYIMTGAMTFHRIPRRAFAGDAEMRAFGEQAKVWHRATGPPLAPEQV